MLSNEANDTEALELLQHLALERISPQWADFLEILSGELGSQLSDVEYRAFLFRMGEKFAQANPIESCATLDDLEAAINRIWRRMSWGYVGFSDQGESMVVAHRACPLSAGLQVDADVAAGFMQGVYSVWLREAGAAPELSLYALASDGQPMLMAFELSAHRPSGS
jgi:hypothetical protein